MDDVTINQLLACWLRAQRHSIFKNGIMFMQVGNTVGLYSGRVEEIETEDGQVFQSAIRKKPAEQLYLDVDGLRGDQSTDAVERDVSFEADHHTHDKTVHLFPHEHYPLIEQKLDCELRRPTFGENFATRGLLEEDVFVGDQLAIGEALICVTMPTERCKTIGRTIGRPKILKVLHEMEACGFYARVLQPGLVCNDSEINLQHREQSVWSIKRLHHFMFNQIDDAELLAEVMALPTLSSQWKSRLQTVIERRKQGKPISSSLGELGLG